MIPKTKVCVSAFLLGLVLSGSSHALGTQASSQAPKTINVSAGVMAGNLEKKVPPVYPPDAKAQRIQGTVVLRVTISPEGAVTSANPIAGPQPLQKAAADAVMQWHYRPYLLGGQPAQVATIVNVVFALAEANAKP